MGTEQQPQRLLPLVISPDKIQLAGQLTLFQQLYREVEALVATTTTKTSRDSSNEYYNRFRVIQIEWQLHLENRPILTPTQQQQNLDIFILQLWELRRDFQSLKPLTGLDIQKQVELIVDTIEKDYDQTLLFEMFTQRASQLLEKLLALCKNANTAHNNLYQQYLKTTQFEEGDSTAWREAHAAQQSLSNDMGRLTSWYDHIISGQHAREPIRTRIVMLQTLISDIERTIERYQPAQTVASSTGKSRR